MPSPRPTVFLAPKGRQGRPPKCPYDLGAAGTKWWRWAWKTPQATQWDTGALYDLARRAQLEDSLAALDQFDPGALEHFFEGLTLGALADPDRLRDALRDLGDVVGRLQSLAGGRLQVAREMRELDDRFGLNARAMNALGWRVATTAVEEKKEDPVDKLKERLGNNVVPFAKQG